MTTTLWALLILAQVSVFALIAFPVETLVESFRVSLGGQAPQRDSPAVAVGVFAALGRAAVLAGMNSAFLAVLFSVFWVERDAKLWVGTTLVLASLAVGYAFKLGVTSPLERAAYVKHSERQRKLAHKTP